MNNTLSINNLSNLTVKDLEAFNKPQVVEFANSLGITLKVRATAKDYIEAIMQHVELSKLANSIETLEAPIKSVWTKTRALDLKKNESWGLELVERALAKNKFKLNMECVEGARFEADDCISVINADGNKSIVVVKYLFQASKGKELPQEDAKKEVAVTEQKFDNASAREKALAEYDKQINAQILKEKANNEKQELDNREFRLRASKIYEAFVQMRNIDLTDMWLVNECKTKLCMNYKVDDLNARYSMFINILTATNQLTKEYISQLITKNFSMTDLYIQGEFDARQRDKYKTWFIEFAENIENNFGVEYYLPKGEQYFCLEGVTNVCLAIYEEAIDVVFNQKLTYGLSLDNGNPVSDKQKEWIKGIVKGYKLKEKKDFPISMEDALKNTITAYAVSYKYSKYRFELVTDKQVKGYLKLLRRQDILVNDEKLANFTEGMQSRYTRTEFSTIMDVMVKNLSLVRLAVAYDKMFKNEIGLACMYISTLNPIEVGTMQRRLELAQNRYLMSLANTEDDK